MLAQRMALKNAAAGLPMGGAKSGLRADPDAPGFERMYRRFARLVSPNLLENGGVFGGFGFDIGARPEHPMWICDELQSLRCFTGKPLEMGGTDYDREGVAGLGVAVAARTAFARVRGSINGVTCAIQGMGAMGAAVYRFLREFGADVRVIADPRLGGGFLLPEQIPDDLDEALASQHFAHAIAYISQLALKKVPMDQIHAQDVEAFFPCAVQDVIHAGNYQEILAEWVFEGANGPCSREAQELLYQKGICVVPDFIANPGGIIAAYIELTSNVTPEENARTRRKVQEAKEYTEIKIAENVITTIELAAMAEVSLVRAGKLLALRNMYQ